MIESAGAGHSGWRAVSGELDSNEIRVFSSLSQSALLMYLKTYFGIEALNNDHNDHEGCLPMPLTVNPLDIIPASF